MAICKLNLHVSTILCASDTKVDLLKGNKKCIHKEHVRQVDKTILEQQIHLERLVKKLNKVRTEVEFTNLELRRVNTHSKRAREVKRNLLACVEKVDTDSYHKLANDIRFREFSTSAFGAEGATRERAIDVGTSRDRSQMKVLHESTSDNVGLRGVGAGPKTALFFGNSAPPSLKQRASEETAESVVVGSKTAMFFGLSTPPPSPITTTIGDNQDPNMRPKTALFFGVPSPPASPDPPLPEESDGSDEENAPAVGPRTAFFFGLSTAKSPPSPEVQPPPSKFIGQASSDGSCQWMPLTSSDSDTSDDSFSDEDRPQRNSRTYSFFNR